MSLIQLMNKMKTAGTYRLIANGGTQFTCNKSYTKIWGTNNRYFDKLLFSDDGRGRNKLTPWIK